MAELTLTRSYVPVVEQIHAKLVNDLADVRSVYLDVYTTFRSQCEFMLGFYADIANAHKEANDLFYTTLQSHYNAWFGPCTETFYFRYSFLYNVFLVCIICPLLVWGCPSVHGISIMSLSRQKFSFGLVFTGFLHLLLTLFVNDVGTVTVVSGGAVFGVETDCHALTLWYQSLTGSNPTYVITYGSYMWLFLFDIVLIVLGLLLLYVSPSFIPEATTNYLVVEDFSQFVSGSSYKFSVLYSDNMAFCEDHVINYDTKTCVPFLYRKDGIVVVVGSKPNIYFMERRFEDGNLVCYFTWLGWSYAPWWIKTSDVVSLVDGYGLLPVVGTIQNYNTRHILIFQVGQCWSYVMAERLFILLSQRVQMQNTMDRVKIVPISDYQRIITTYFKDNNLPDSKVMQLASMFAVLISKRMLPTFASLSAEAFTYTYLPNLTDLDPIKSSGRFYCGQLVTNGAYFPSISFQSDAYGVSERINKVRNTITKWPDKYFEYMNEFLVHLVPDDLVGTGYPMGFEEVYDRQKRPIQRTRMDVLRDRVFSILYSDKREKDTFAKREPYAKKISPARLITTMDPEQLVLYSGFIYPFVEDVLKKQKYYGFGLTPLEIVARVRELADCCDYFVPTDYTKWDGTHSQLLADFEKAILQRYFCSDFHSEIARLVDEHYGTGARTSNGFRYHIDFQRNSGSADTSAFNTLDNALLAYVALRESGYDSASAYERLGLYGGDDGLSICVDPAVYERVSTSMGHTLKATVVRQGDVVPFLGRHYCDPWTTNTSVIDIPRVLCRFHATVASIAVPDILVFHRKISSLCCTDPSTPFITDLALAWSRVIERTGARARIDRGIVRYSHELSLLDSWIFNEMRQVSTDVVFPQDPDDFEPVFKNLDVEFGISQLDYTNWVMRLEAVTLAVPSVEDFIKELPILVTRDLVIPNVPIEVGGALHNIPPSVPRRPAKPPMRPGPALRGAENA